MQKYSESNSVKKRCIAESIDIAKSKDVYVTNSDTYPMLTINGAGFTSAMTFGKHKAQLFINHIEEITKFKAANDAEKSLILRVPGLTVELYLGCCDKILKYENTIREFINNPGFSGK